MLIQITATVKWHEVSVVSDVPDAEWATLPFEELAKRYLEPGIGTLRTATTRYDIATDTQKPAEATAGDGVIQSSAKADLPFDQALELAKKGAKITRRAWKEAWLEFDPTMLPHLKFMPVHTVWPHSRADMVARDWAVKE